MEEQTQEEVKKETPPPPPEKPKTRDEIKKEILAKPEHKRDAKEKKKLREIEREEAEEKKRGALIHNMASDADKWGRKQISSIRRTVTEKVKAFSDAKKVETDSSLRTYRAAVKDLDKQTRAEMQRIQEAHNVALNKIREEQSNREERINGQYAGLFKEAEEELENEAANISNLVGGFTASLGSMTIEQLETLSSEGFVEVSEGDFIKAFGR